MKALTDRLSSLDKALAESRQDERQIQEAVEAAASSAAKDHSVSAESSEGHQEDDVTPAESPEKKNHAGPPPPIQHQNKIRYSFLTPKY